MVSFLPYTCSLSWFVNYLPNCIEKRYLSNTNNCSEVANSSHESTCLTPYIPPYQKVKLITGALLGINQCVSQRPTIVIELVSKNSRTRLYLGPIIFFLILYLWVPLLSTIHLLVKIIIHYSCKISKIIGFS